MIVEVLYICIYLEELKDWLDVFYRLYFEEKKIWIFWLVYVYFDIVGFVLDIKVFKLMKVRIRKIIFFFSGCNFLKYFFLKVYIDLGVGI